MEDISYLFNARPTSSSQSEVGLGYEIDNPISGKVETLHCRRLILYRTDMDRSEVNAKCYKKLNISKQTTTSRINCVSYDATMETSL